MWHQDEAVLVRRAAKSVIMWAKEAKVLKLDISEHIELIPRGPLVESSEQANRDDGI